MRYVDVATGKQVVRSTKATNQRDAERAAAKWEAELREGRYHRPTRTTWDEFRERYENEVLASLAKATNEKVGYLFDKVEAILSPAMVKSLTTERVSYFQSQLRATGKLAEQSIKSHLAHLGAALRWAVKMGFIAKAPTIEMPRRGKTQTLMKGRPITTAEFDRMLAAVPKVMGTAKPRNAKMANQSAAVVESWEFYLRGLWLSGLRLEESLELCWDRDDKLCVDLAGNHPMLRIPRGLEKGNQDRHMPLSPEFAEFLLEIPVPFRTGFVFAPLPRWRKTDRILADYAGVVVCDLGKEAGVKVQTSEKGKVKYASAHDLRRSFGERWASRVMPTVLQQLMRHENIETTLRYYVGRNAQATADVLWAAHESAKVTL